MAKTFITRIGGYAIDCVVSESHEAESDVTAFPVERGADVNDNVRRKSRKLTIEGIVSDTPIGEIAVERDNAQGAGVLSSAAALNVLDDFWSNGTPVVVETAIRTYPSMVLSTFSVPRDKDTGRALRFSGSFTELRIRENRRTVILVRPDVRAQGAGKLGGKSVKPVGKALTPEQLKDIRANAAKLEKETLDKVKQTFGNGGIHLDPAKSNAVHAPWWANTIGSVTGINSGVGD